MMKRTMLLALSWGTLAATPLRAPDLPTQKLPVYGGSGGIAFERSCGAGKVLTGFRYRSGFFVDAVGLLCRPVNADGKLGSETTVGTLAGGGGGTSKSVSCPAGTVVATAWINAGTFVDGVMIGCHSWGFDTRTFDPLPHKIQLGNWDSTLEKEVCEDSRQPAKGIRGRSATYVDAFGMICDEP